MRGSAKNIPTSRGYPVSPPVDEAQIQPAHPSRPKPRDVNRGASVNREAISSSRGRRVAPQSVGAPGGYGADRDEFNRALASPGLNRGGIVGSFVDDGGEAGEGGSRRGRGQDEPGARDGTRDAHVADDAIDLCHAVRWNGVALRCEGRAGGRYESRVDRSGNVGAAGEDEIGAEAIALADVEDGALGACGDQIAREHGGDRLAESPSEAGRGRHGDDIERRSVRRNADGPEVGGLVEDRAEDVEVGDGFAGLEVEGLFGTARPILVIAEELHRERSGRGADVRDRGVRRIEGAIETARMSARGKKPDVRRGDRKR